MTFVSTAVLLMIGTLAGPAGTLVCRLQCSSAAKAEVEASSHCTEHASANAVLRPPAATPCNELAGAPAVKQERFEDPGPASIGSPVARLEAILEASQRPASSPPRPRRIVAFIGTDLPLRI